MQRVAKYARTILNSIEKRPEMHGDGFAVEMQYLTALEFLSISEGFEPESARQAYSAALRKRFKTDCMPAASYGLSARDIVEVIRHARDDIDPSRWVDMTGL